MDPCKTFLEQNRQEEKNEWELDRQRIKRESGRMNRAGRRVEIDRERGPSILREWRGPGRFTITAI